MLDGHCNTEELRAKRLAEIRTAYGERAIARERCEGAFLLAELGRREQELADAQEAIAQIAAEVEAAVAADAGFRTYSIPPEPDGTVEVLDGDLVGQRFTRRGRHWWLGPSAVSWIYLITVCAGPAGVREVCRECEMATEHKPSCSRSGGGVGA